MVSALRPIGTSYSVSYTSQISRLIFSTILQATDDSATVFGDALDFSSELVLWAHAQTEWCSTLLQRYVLSSAASSGGLRLAAECVQIAVVHCSLLEERGLALAPVLLRLVRPSVEEVSAAPIAYGCGVGGQRGARELKALVPGLLSSPYYSDSRECSCTAVAKGSRRKESASILWLACRRWMPTFGGSRTAWERWQLRTTGRCMSCPRRARATE